MAHNHIFNLPREWQWNEFCPDQVIKRFHCKKCDYEFSATVRIDELEKDERDEIKSMIGEGRWRI